MQKLKHVTSLSINERYRDRSCGYDWKTQRIRRAIYIPQRMVYIVPLSRSRPIFGFNAIHTVHISCSYIIAIHGPRLDRRLNLYQCQLRRQVFIKYTNSVRVRWKNTKLTTTEICIPAHAVHASRISRSCIIAIHGLVDSSTFTEVNYGEKYT